MSHYKTATVAPVHLKIVVSFVLSIMLAITVGLTLKTFLSVNLAIDKQAALHQP